MILLILKIIGKILLILLFVVIAIILLLLFTPFGYLVNAEYYDKFKAKVRFHDFIRFLSVRFDYEGEPDFSVYILWGKVKIYPKGAPKEKKPKKKLFQKKNSKVFDENFTEREVSEEEAEEYRENLYRTNTESTATVNVTKSETETDADNDHINAKPETENADTKPENSAADKVPETDVNADTSTEKTDASADQDNSVKDKDISKQKTKKAKKPKKKKQKKSRPAFSSLLKEIMAEEYATGRKILIDKILKLIKHIWPDIKEADVTFSLGEPDTTGYATAVLAMMPFIYGKKKVFSPDFTSEKPYFRGYIIIDGRLFLYYVLYIVISLFANKDSRKLIMKLIKG